MNDPILYGEKLRALVDLAKTAETEFEKATVFSATQAIAATFSAEEENFDGYLLEKVELARWHICASVGYDIHNGHDRQQHILWALGSVQTLQELLKQNRN